MTNKELKALCYKIIDLIDYEEHIGKLPDCNTCVAQKDCTQVPRPGEFTRINCFAWEGKEVVTKKSASEAMQKIREYEEKQRDCKTCKHSNNGKIAGTETCHECMYNSQYEEKNCENCQYKDKLDAKCLFCDKEQTAGESRDIRDIAIQGYIGTMMCNGYTIAEIEKVLKAMQEGKYDNA